MPGRKKTEKHHYGWVMILATGRTLRLATAAELKRSKKAKSDHGAFHDSKSGRIVFVSGE